MLFYVYPLKFFFTFLVDKFTGGHGETKLADGTVTTMMDNVDQMGKLMLIFSAGYLAVFTVFVLLYLHAYRKRAELDLNRLEVLDTRSSIQESALNCVIVHGTMGGRRRRRMEAALAPESPAEAGEPSG